MTRVKSKMFLFSPLKTISTRFKLSWAISNRGIACYQLYTRAENSVKEPVEFARDKSSYVVGSEFVNPFKPIVLANSAEPDQTPRSGLNT